MWAFECIYNLFDCNIFWHVWFIIFISIFAIFNRPCLFMKWFLRMLLQNYFNSLIAGFPLHCLFSKFSVKCFGVLLKYFLRLKNFVRFSYLRMLTAIIILFREFFTPAFADSFSLEWQQVSSGLQDSSQYSGRSQ